MEAKKNYTRGETLTKVKANNHSHFQPAVSSESHESVVKNDRSLAVRVVLYIIYYGTNGFEPEAHPRTVEIIRLGHASPCLVSPNKQQKLRIEN